MSAWAAAGRLIGYYEPHMNPWDGLPGLVLMREAAASATTIWQTTGFVTVIRCCWPARRSIHN
ncbi:inositol-1-monophosphatase [Klebsiella michiganensis]|uniref:Inositol-1-monophosphatase n=1 Tax=Klebsiella michiganensis TaxID=1134687 RepID=A0A7H4N4X1_9ENTR|nr:inositol-1-monophosphatase [Klebsiella michiganensis]